MKDFFLDRSILITGGTGSWGEELTRQLLALNPREIRIFSRSEFQQVRMERKFNDRRLRFLIGDVRDRDRLVECTRGVDYLYHLAALKHVPVCEEQPYEAIKTNISGVQNVIEAAKLNGVQKVIDVSTDKAVDPLNLYGMTKAIGERLMIQANLGQQRTQFICIRSGNVLGTNGSVVPFFIDQIKRFGKIILTDKRMTRFFLPIERAIRLLFAASTEGRGGETFVLRMPACRIVDIADVLMNAHSPHPVPVEEVGVRPGEKIHEVLVSRYEAPLTLHYSEDYYLILPQLRLNGLLPERSGLAKASFIEYTSNDSVLSKHETHNMLKLGGYL